MKNNVVFPNWAFALSKTGFPQELTGLCLAPVHYDAEGVASIREQDFVYIPSATMLLAQLLADGKENAARSALARVWLDGRAPRAAGDAK